MSTVEIGQPENVNALIVVRVKGKVIDARDVQLKKRFGCNWVMFAEITALVNP